MIIYCVLLIGIGIIIYSFIENRCLKTVHYHICMDSDGIVQRWENDRWPEDVVNKTECIRIVQLSDLHGCHYGTANDTLYHKIKSCNPDLILFTGDIITKNTVVPTEVVLLLERLASEHPCMYSLGNHELKERRKNPERFEAYTKLLQQAGIRVLDNEIHELVIKGRKLILGAYSSTVENYTKSIRPHEKSVNIPQVDCGDNCVSILLSHDPELVKHYTNSRYSLIFSGHLHGGIVRIPGWRGVISTQFKIFPRYAGGYYQLKDKQAMIVSRGLGSHTIKFRLFNRPELVHADIYILSKSQR